MARGIGGRCAEIDAVDAGRTRFTCDGVFCADLVGKFAERAEVAPVGFVLCTGFAAVGSGAAVLAGVARRLRGVGVKGPAGAGGAAGKPSASASGLNVPGGQPVISAASS